jgi:acetylornithine deacetylase/succinyl-diaminopimelate desuccinylase-like protein
VAETVRRIAALTDHSRELTFNVGVISGSSGLNRVPPEAMAEDEFRAFAPETYAQGRQELF